MAFVTALVANMKYLINAGHKGEELMRTRSLLLAFMTMALFTGTNAMSQQSSKTENMDKPQTGKAIRPTRRVVTGTNAAGKSTVIFDGVPPNIISRPRGAGGGFALYWFTDSMPADNSGNKDATL